jgi:hypothetical protein
MSSPFEGRRQKCIRPWGSVTGNLPKTRLCRHFQGLLPDSPSLARNRIYGVPPSAKQPLLTIVWMTVETIVSLGTAWTSHSPALLAFGGDSLIEMLSAAVVFWRFRFTLGEARAARIAASLLFALAGFVVLTSILNLIGYGEAHRSLVGMGVLLAAAVVMPWLATRKRNLAVVTSSAALKADAAEPAFCGYMALDCPYRTSCERYLEQTVG